MHLGISSWTYTWAVGVPGCPAQCPLQPLDLVERAGALGVRALQICDNLPLHTRPEAELAALARRAGELGVQIEVGTRGIAPQHLRQYLELATRFRSPLVRIVVDTAEHQPDPDEIVATLRRLAPEFERAGVCLAIENHDRFRARELAQIIEQIASPQVGVCLDTVNSFGAMEGPEVVVETLAPLAVNLHLKDFCIRRANHSMGFVLQGRPAGQGQLDVPWLLESVQAHGRSMSAILEQWTPPEPDLAATIAKEAAWAEESIRYLRTLLPS